MLGFMSRQPVPIEWYLWKVPRSLHWLSLNGCKAPHRDGYGLVYKDNNGAMRLDKWGREALTQAGDQRLPELDNIKTTLLIAHARQASVGYKHMTTSAEAHPFFENGIYLAHNGTIKDAGNLDAGEGTDTQKLLRWLTANWTTRNLSSLEEALQKLLKEAKDYTGIDLLITEGSSLYAFCCYRREPGYYTLHYRIADGLAIVASEPLDKDPKKWQPLANGELLEITPDLEIKRKRLKWD
jgi:predicted glutamine amidotransferase